MVMIHVYIPKEVSQDFENLDIDQQKKIRKKASALIVKELKKVK